jgi:hypothetical protein
MGCLQLVALGVLAGYLRRLVFARDLPSYIIRESHLVDESGAPAAAAAAAAGRTMGESHG